MISAGKFMFIIYVLVFISVKLFYCIDVSSETVTLAVTVDDDVNGTTRDTISTVSGKTDNQTTELESTTQAQEYKNAMQMCNESFPTPKGTVCQ